MIKHYLLAASLALGAGSPWAQQAQAADDHGAHHAAPAAPAAEFATGEVRKVDVATGKVTLKHGEIKNLDMPPMTMVFVAADPAVLAKLKPGDKVRFRAADQGGKMTVTEIERVD